MMSRIDVYTYWENDAEELPGKRKRERPKRRFMDAVREDMAVAEVTEHDSENRTEWRWNILLGNSCRKKTQEEEDL